MTDTLTLTSDQEEAREVVMRSINLGARHTSLTGYAGTGKTFLAGVIAGDLKAMGHKVYACAPTHKAAYVLESKMDVDTQTIHSFLGLSVVRDGRGGYTLRQRLNTALPQEGVVLLDESSMVGKQLWRFIDSAYGLQWVFIGDPAQLPPVAERPSPALDVGGARLERIVRQAEGNPILRLATAVREGRPWMDEVGFSEGIGVAVCTSPESFLQSALRGFRAQPESRPPEVRMLAYRNVVVRYYNDRVRRLLHGGARLPRFVQGDWLMMLDTYFEDQIPVCKNSEEVRVLHAETDEWPSVGGFWKVHLVTVQREGGDMAIIPVLHESEDGRFGQTLAQFRNEAIDQKRPWKDYYDLLERFAKVDYAYAMTVHKSQGSTFHTAYVDHRDLETCKGPEKQALFYVAATRPSHRLALLI